MPSLRHFLKIVVKRRMAVQTNRTSKLTKRWVFIILVFASLLYLGLGLARVLEDANATFGSAAQIDNASLSTMVVHRNSWTPPRDSQLRPFQIHTFERILRALDTIPADTTNVIWIRRKTMATLLNEHGMSLEEYRWVRSEVQNILQSDSAESSISEPTLSSLYRLQRVLRREEDSEALRDTLR